MERSPVLRRAAASQPTMHRADIIGTVLAVVFSVLTIMVLVAAWMWYRRRRAGGRPHTAVRAGGRPHTAVVVNPVSQVVIASSATRAARVAVASAQRAPPYPPPPAAALPSEASASEAESETEVRMAMHARASAGGTGRGEAALPRPPGRRSETGASVSSAPSSFAAAKLGVAAHSGCERSCVAAFVDVEEAGTEAGSSDDASQHGEDVG